MQAAKTSSRPTPLAVNWSCSPPIFSVSNLNDGIYLINKPKGLTSHDVISIIKKKFNLKKIGHTGTLDPLATGLLIVLVGRQYTRKQSEFLKKDKQYQVVIKLGIQTDSYDSDGEITKKAPQAKLKKITKHSLGAAINKFRGEVSQTVPPFSAVKVKGKKLYQLARQKKLPCSLPARTVVVKQLKLLSFNASTHKAKLLVDCSSGTYIRSLVHDIGRELSVGAHVVKLHRTQIGDLNVSQVTNLQKKSRGLH